MNTNELTAEAGDLRHESFALEDVRIRLYGSAGVAVGMKTEQSRYQGGDGSGRFRVTQVAVVEDGRWQLAGIHQSPIATPPGTPGR